MFKRRKKKKPVSTENQLRVGGVSLSLQRSYKHIDEPKPQGQERDGLIVGPSVLLIEFAFQQNLKMYVKVVNKSAKSCFQNASIRIYIGQEKKR